MSWLDDLIAQITGGSGGSGSAASVSRGMFSGGGGGGSGPGGLLSSLSGFGGAPTGGTLGNVEGGINTGLRAASLIPGPQQIPLSIAAAIAPFIESLFGGGVPREAKTSAVGAAASASGDPIDAILGKYINQGVAGGHVLSESSPRNFELGTERMAAILEALTGHQSPNVQGQGFQNNPNLNLPQLGQIPFQLPQGYGFMGTDPTSLNKAMQDIVQAQGQGATDIWGPSGQQEWQKIVQELIQQGVLNRYTGPTGAVGSNFAGPGGVGNPGTASPLTTAMAAGSGNIPNIALPHPLAQNAANQVPPPYPV